jgi:hypothetical protein
MCLNAEPQNLPPATTAIVSSKAIPLSDQFGFITIQRAGKQQLKLLVYNNKIATK